MSKLVPETVESLRMALSALAGHKLRSGLTLLGVLVGVFSIILVMTAMRAMQNNIEQQLGSLGSKTLVVQRMPGAYFGGPEGFTKFFRRHEITFAQALAFRKKADFAPWIGVAMDVSTGAFTSRFAVSPPNVEVSGIMPANFVINNWTVSEGRGLQESDIDSAREVCLLSDDVANTLFPAGGAIGQRITGADARWTVVGVFTRAASAEVTGGMAVVPISTALNRYGRRRDVSILVQTEDAARLPEVAEQSRGLLRALRKVPPGEDDDFEVLTSDAMIEQFQKVTFAVRTGLSLVSSIALLAAGVGIMNIMLVSVTERTREIGIRRAIGAKKRNIMMQFIIEAVVLCEIGGLLGIVLGISGANALAIYWLKLPPAFPLDWAVIGLGICSLIGVVFGSYPAWKAANLDPIESLRYE